MLPATKPPGPASSVAGQRTVPSARRAGLPGRSVSRRGRISRIASGWPSSHSIRSPNDRRSRRCCAAGNGASRCGVLGGLVPGSGRPPRSGGHGAEPVLLGAAGDQHRAAPVVAHPLQELPQPVQPASSSGGVARPGRASPGPTRSCPTPAASGAAAAAVSPLAARCAGSRRANLPEQAQADLGDHAVQAEGRHARLEGVPEHPAAGLHPAGIPPPAGERLGQLGLPRPARAGQDDHASAAGPRPPDRRTGRHGRRTRTTAARSIRSAPTAWGRARLVQRLVQRRPPVGRRHWPAGSGPRGASSAPAPASRPAVGRPSGWAAPSCANSRLRPAVTAWRHAAAGEQRLVKRGHELRRRDRVDAVGHGDHRRAASLQQRGRHRGFQFLAHRPGLAGVQHHDRDLACGEGCCDLGRRYIVTAPPGNSNASTPSARACRRTGVPADRSTPCGPGGHDTMPVEMHHVERLARLGSPQHFVSEGFKCRRPQHRELDVSAHRLQSLQQRPRNHLIPHVVRTTGTGNHHQHP